MKTKFNFDCGLTFFFDGGNPWKEFYFHFIPRMTLFVSPISETKKDWEGNDCLCYCGEEYDLQIGWLCFEISISMERLY